MGESPPETGLELEWVKVSRSPQTAARSTQTGGLAPSSGSGRQGAQLPIPPHPAPRDLNSEVQEAGLGLYAFRSSLHLLLGSTRKAPSAPRRDKGNGGVSALPLQARGHWQASLGCVPSLHQERLTHN